jgi:hypothetical protein
MDQRTKVTILTSSYRIKGYIDLLPGAQKRLAAPFINVSRAHIEIIFPGH